MFAHQVHLPFLSMGLKKVARFCTQYTLYQRQICLIDLLLLIKQETRKTCQMIVLGESGLPSYSKTLVYLLTVKLWFTSLQYNSSLLPYSKTLVYLLTVKLSDACYFGIEP